MGLNHPRKGGFGQPSGRGPTQHAGVKRLPRWRHEGPCTPRRWPGALGPRPPSVLRWVAGYFDAALFASAAIPCASCTTFLYTTSAHALIIVVGTRRALGWVTEPREAVATVGAAPGSRGPKTLHAAANLRLCFCRHEFVLRVDCNGYARDDAPKSARIVRSVTRPARSLRVARPRVRRRRRCESDLRSPPRRPSPEQSDTNGGPAPERPTLWCAQLGCALTGLGSS